MKEHGFELVSLEPASGRGFDMHTLRRGGVGASHPLRVWVLNPGRGTPRFLFY